MQLKKKEFREKRGGSLQKKNPGKGRVRKVTLLKKEPSGNLRKKLDLREKERGGGRIVC